MKHPSAIESARTLPRKWIDENWGFCAGTQHDHQQGPAGRSRQVRPRSAPTTRRKEKAFVYHTYTGRRVSPDQQQQQHVPLHRRHLKGVIEVNTDVSLPDSWGRGGGPSFAPKGVGPLLEPPRPPKEPTKPSWPTRTIGASALRYVGIVRREKKGVVDGGRPVPEVLPVSWPEHIAMEAGDVVVTVEHCHGCHRHRMTTRHDPEVYLRQAHAAKDLLIESLQEAPIRLAVLLKKTMLRSKALPQGGRGSGAAGETTSAVWQRRVGAFEVQVAARHPSRAHLLQVRVVHSKLACGRWPRLERDAHLPTRVKATLASWGFESNRRQDSNVDAGLDDRGATGESLSEQCRPPSRSHISWEFDNRDWLRCAAVPTVPPLNSTNSNSNSNTETRAGQASTPAPGNDDAERSQGQAEPHGTPEDAGMATIAERDFDAGESAAGVSVNKAKGKPFGGEGAGDGGCDSVSHAGSEVGAAIDAGISWEPEAEPSENASAVAGTETTASSAAVAKAPATPPGLLGSGSESDADGKECITTESGFFPSVRPAASAGSPHGDSVATGLEGRLGEERDHDRQTEDLASSTDVGNAKGISTARPSRGRRQEHESRDHDSPASAREGGGETGGSRAPMRSVRERQEKHARSSSVGEAYQAPNECSSGAPNGCSSDAPDDSEADGSRAPKKMVEGNPAASNGGEKESASVWSSSTSNNNSSNSSTGRNTSPIESSRRSPKTASEGKSTLDTPALTRSGLDVQKKALFTAKKGAESGESDGDISTAGTGATFALPNVPTPDADGGSGWRGTSGEADGGDNNDESITSPTGAGRAKPTSRTATQRGPGVNHSGSTGEVESRRSTGHRETGEGGEGEGWPAVGDSRTVGEEEPVSAAEGDEYGSDFASQGASSVEEVVEGNAIPGGAPPSGRQREDTGTGESGEEFQWSDTEETEKRDEEEEEEEEYGDDFDDDAGEFDSS